MDLPNRKYPRLKQYDYSLPGYYYVTIHLQSDNDRLSTVGWGLAPAEAQVELMPAGEIVQAQLLVLRERYPNVRIDKYVIMPNHIHAIIQLLPAVGASPHPTLMQIVGAYKSLTTRRLNAAFGSPGKKWFQTSFFETVLRNEKAYQACWKYIDENPLKMILGYHR